MSQPGAGGPPFRTSRSDVVTAALRELARQADREGRGAEFRAALAKIDESLRDRPWDFGEPLYPLPNARVRVRVASSRPLSVRFAVHEDLAVVFVLGYELMAGPTK